MKRITVKINRKDIYEVDIYVDDGLRTSLLSRAVYGAIKRLGGVALIVPSREGAMEMRYSAVEYGYKLWDNNHDMEEWFCISHVEDAIGVDFQNKPFTFYLREI
jgi:hypothetical protein